MCNAWNMSTQNSNLRVLATLLRVSPPAHSNDQTPFDSSIPTDRPSSSDLRPASKMALVAIVFFSVGRPFLSNSSNVALPSFREVTASTYFSKLILEGMEHGRNIAT